MKYFILLLFLIFSISILSANSDINKLNCHAELDSVQLIGKNYQENELPRVRVDSVKVVIFEKPYEKPIVANRFEYLPYGESWITEGEGVNNPKYNSQELDKETNFYFYNARRFRFNCQAKDIPETNEVAHYDPEIARFVTADTVIDGELSSVGWNRYAYVKGNPVRYKDPTGHTKEYFETQAGTRATTIGPPIPESNSNHDPEALAYINTLGGSLTHIVSQWLNVSEDQSRANAKIGGGVSDIIESGISGKVVKPNKNGESVVKNVAKNQSKAKIKSNGRYTGRSGGGSGGTGNKNEEYIRLRHFTSPKGAKGIQESGVIKAMDQNKVFNVKAKSKAAKGSREIADKLGIKRNKAKEYIEYDAKKSEVEVIINKDTGMREHNIKGDVILEGRNPKYYKTR
jgi:RHS repeat-associated protein